MWSRTIEYPFLQPVPAPASTFPIPMPMPMPIIPHNYPLLFSRQPIPFCTSAPSPVPRPQQSEPEMTSILLQQQQQQQEKQRQLQYLSPRPRLIVMKPQPIPIPCAAAPNYTYNFSYYPHSPDLHPHPHPHLHGNAVHHHHHASAVTNDDPDLERRVLSLLEKHKMTLKNMSRRWFMLKKLETLLCFGEVHPFGSFLTGLGSDSSDVDVYFQDQENRRKDVVMKLVLYAIEEKSGEGGDENDDDESGSDSGTESGSEKNRNPWKILQVLTHARIPLITLEHGPSGIKIDISFENKMSVQNSKLIRFYAKLEPSVSLLCRLIRHWADINKLMDCRKGLKNYSITLFVLVFLMRRNLIPTVGWLQSLCPPEVIKVTDGNPGAGTGSDEYEWNIGFCDELVRVKGAMAREGVASQPPPRIIQLTLEFFQMMWRIVHLPDCAVVSLTGEIRARSDFSHENKGKLPASQSRYSSQVSVLNKERFSTRSQLCLQDPFDLSFNVTHNVDSNYLQLLRSALHVAIATIEGQRGQSNGKGILRLFFSNQECENQQQQEQKSNMSISNPVTMATPLNPESTAPSPFLGSPVFHSPISNPIYQHQNQHQFLNILGVNSNLPLPVPNSLPVPVPDPSHSQNFGNFSSQPPEIPLFTQIWSLSDVLRRVSSLYCNGKMEKNLLSLDSLSPYELSQYRQFWYEAAVDYFKFEIQTCLPITHKSELKQKAEFCRPRTKSKSNSNLDSDFESSNSNSNSSSSLDSKPEPDTEPEVEKCNKSSCDCQDGGRQLPTASNLSFSFTLDFYQLIQQQKQKQQQKDKKKRKKQPQKNWTDLVDFSILVRITILKNDQLQLSESGFSTDDSAQVKCTVCADPSRVVNTNDRKLLATELEVSFSQFAATYIHRKIKDSWALGEILQEKRWMEMGEEVGGTSSTELEPEVEPEVVERSRKDSQVTESSLDFSVGFSISDQEDQESMGKQVESGEELDINSLSSWPPLEKLERLEKLEKSQSQTRKNSTQGNATYLKLSKNGLIKLAAQRNPDPNPDRH